MMYYLYLLNDKNDDFVRLVKSEDIQVLVYIAMTRDITELPDFTISNQAINFDESEYIEVKI